MYHLSLISESGPLSPRPLSPSSTGSPAEGRRSIWRSLAAFVFVLALLAGPMSPVRASEKDDASQPPLAESSEPDSESTAEPSARGDVFDQLTVVGGEDMQ